MAEPIGEIGQTTFEALPDASPCEVERELRETVELPARRRGAKPARALGSDGDRCRRAGRTTDDIPRSGEVQQQLSPVGIHERHPQRAGLDRPGAAGRLSLADQHVAGPHDHEGEWFCHGHAALDHGHHSRVSTIATGADTESGHRRGRAMRPGPEVHDDLVCRDFSADRPNQLWPTDISEHPTDEGKLYICAIKDAWSGRIVGCSIADRMTASLAVGSLHNAVRMRGTCAGTIVHSDRGGQLRSMRFTRALRGAGLWGSMGRVGTCADNAAMESFLALLQKNVLDRKRWATREELRLEIVIWIERTYHRRRRQRALGKLTPIEFETIFEVVYAA